jgi:hypothetical protein
MQAIKNNQKLQVWALQPSIQSVVIQYPFADAEF